MKEKKNEQETVATQQTEENEASAQPNVEEALRDALVSVQKLEKELAGAQEQNQQLADKHLRLAAEYDNYKKRTAKEKEELLFAAKAQVIKTLLPVFDNLDRAKECTTDAQKLAEGVELILKQFVTCLEQLDVHEIPALNESFDPAVHEAVFHEEAEDQPENTVTQVLQKGYICGEKVIRHAMVKVVN